MEIEELILKKTSLFIKQKVPVLLLYYYHMVRTPCRRGTEEKNPKDEEGMAKRGVHTGKRYYPGTNTGAAARELEYIDITLREPPQRRKRSREEILARRKKRRRQRMFARTVLVSGILFSGILLGFLLWKAIGIIQESGAFTRFPDAQRTELIRENDTSKPVITENFLTVNPYSRPGEPLDGVKNIFVHYTANKKTSASQNRSYFENLGITGETSASAHFIIGYEGEIIQCLPLNEIGYAVKTRNYDSVSIECCYLDENGKFTDATYRSLIQLTAWLLKEYKLTPEDVLRHYDVGGKKCPLYFVDHEDSWEQFRQDLTDYILEK